VFRGDSGKAKTVIIFPIILLQEQKVSCLFLSAQNVAKQACSAFLIIKKTSPF